MQKFASWMVIFSVLALISAGCGGGDKKQETSEPASTPSSETASPEMEQSAAVVREFIAAMIKGYDEQAFSLLSKKAQNEYQRMGRELGFSANDQTEFKIEGVAAIPDSNNELFGVAVTMKEPEGNEVKVTQSSWGVRNENGKFSIIGVVLNDNGMTMELDFEDLVGTDAKMQALYEQQMQAQETIATAPHEYNMTPPQQQPQQQSPGLTLPQTQPSQSFTPQFDLPPQSSGQTSPQIQSPAYY